MCSQEDREGPRAQEGAQWLPATHSPPSQAGRKDGSLQGRLSVLVSLSPQLGCGREQHVKIPETEAVESLLCLQAG